MLGIIGGSGFCKTVKGKARHIETPYGWVQLVFGKLGKKQVIFMERHGKGHEVPPHAINHRANIYALQMAGAQDVVGVNACGIISKFKAGDMVTIDDFLASHLGPITFYDTFKYGVKHTDMGEPYSRKINALIAKAGRKGGVKVKGGGIVATAFGPRFETPAEIRAFKMLGANLISMTSAYEAILAKELGINYASVAVGTNYAAGISKKPLTYEEVVAVMEKSERRVVKLLGMLAALM